MEARSPSAQAFVAERVVRRFAAEKEFDVDHGTEQRALR
jgi:hypothetical protein